MPPGHLALVLHAHLPFVHHPEQEHFLEEEWFFEAITETYIPLLRMMQRLVDDAVQFKVTMSISPPLSAMLQDELLRERYVRHLDLSIDLAVREQRRNREHPQLREFTKQLPGRIRVLTTRKSLSHVPHARGHPTARFP